MSKIAFSDSLTTPCLWQAFACSLGAPKVSIGNGCRPGILCPVPGTTICLKQTANTCVQLTDMSSYGIVWCVVLRQHSRHMQFSVCQILSLLMTFPLKTFQSRHLLIFLRRSTRQQPPASPASIATTRAILPRTVRISGENIKNIFK